ncbi:MAG: shikimate dehydrogenase [Bradyrhizobium sp.]|nr:MAG: shikimate dehydrogenase [Bradyrhizobium sp.]
MASSFQTKRLARTSVVQSPIRSARRALLGLIGSPIGGSASPAMHEAAGDAVGMRCHYQLIDVANADATELARLLHGVRRLGFAGVNVTFPYKEAVLALLDALSPGARTVGSVNTVVVRDGALTGHNTDATGFRRAVQPLVEASGRGAVALLGAGGVGKAIAFALAELSVAEIRVFDIDFGKAEALAARFDDRARLMPCRSVAEALAGAVGVVNGTPVGMTPNRDTPVPAALLNPDLFVVDAVYSPLWTPLLVAAKAVGARTMTGRDLAVFQAADAFELFVGVKPPIEPMAEAFDRVMANRERGANAA